MIDAGVVSGGRVTHRDASVDDLANAAPESQRRGVSDLLERPGVDEAFVLSTCNRVEAYVVTNDPAVGEATIEVFFADVEGPLRISGHDESLHHLLRVAAGLESVVLGEDQIMGQVRTAYEDARGAGGIGPMLDPAVTKAIRVGERARTETAINEGVVSLGSAATRLVADRFSLDGASALVVGAGEMGRLAARSLADEGVGELVVANRTISHAEHVVGDLAVDANAVGLDALPAVIPRVDVIVTATACDEPLIAPTHLGDIEQVVVDLGQPRNVCPGVDSVPGVTVYDLDDLESITEETREERAEAAARVDAIVEEEFASLCEQYKRTRADEVIAAMYESAERIKRRELETAFTRTDEELTDEQREVIRAMADSLVGQLLAAPTKSLRDAAAEDDWSTINTALHLFDPEFGPELSNQDSAEWPEAAAEASDGD